MNAEQKMMEGKIDVKSLIYKDAYRKRFEDVLGQRANQFMASVVNASMQQGLDDCDPKSIIAASFVAATLDLPIDRNLGFAYIVPYKRIGQFQIGYKGLIQLALRSGQYIRMNAKAINQEAFAGFDEYGEPIFRWDQLDETQESIGYAFVWKLASGFTKKEFWTKERIDLHAKRYSQAFRQDKKESPWFTNYEEMALKTVIKQSLRQWGILSIQMQFAIEEDQVTEEIKPINSLGEVQIEPPKRITQLAELNRKLKEANPHLEEKANVHVDQPRSGGVERANAPADESTSPTLQSTESNEPTSKLVQEEAREVLEQAKQSEQQGKEVLKEAREALKKRIPRTEAKERTQLVIEIQDKLFKLNENPEDIEAMLKKVSSNTKCGMGHIFLTVEELGKCENVPWLREISEELNWLMK